MNTNITTNITANITAKQKTFNKLILTQLASLSNEKETEPCILMDANAKLVLTIPNPLALTVAQTKLISYLTETLGYSVLTKHGNYPVNLAYLRTLLAINIVLELSPTELTNTNTNQEELAYAS